MRRITVARVRIRLPFARQVLLLQIAVVVLVVGLGAMLVGVLVRRELTEQYSERALAVARSAAADPAVAAGDPQQVLQDRAERLRQATGALFVVVTDRAGLRLSHPNPEQIGRLVSTEPAALSGREVTVVERGTLGLSARGKVPLRTPDAGWSARSVSASASARSGPGSLGRR